MGKIPVGIVGVGNCASSLVQGIEWYRAEDREPIGLMHSVLGGYHPGDLEVVCAFDVDRRKVGATLDVAVMALPNNTRPLCPKLHVVAVFNHPIRRGPISRAVGRLVARNA